MDWREGLSDKQIKFVEEYLVDLNATQAAIRAGYSKKTANPQAARLLANVSIQEALAAYREELKSDNDITAERVVAEYAKLAFLDPRRFYNDKGELIAVNELPAEVAAALTAYEVNDIYDGSGKHRATNRKIKYSDKKSSLDSLARTLGMFVDKTELTGKDGKPLIPVVNLTLTHDDG